MPTVEALFHMFQSGGFVMYPLLLCSLAACTVALERYWRFRGVAKGLIPFFNEATTLLGARKFEDLKILCARNESLPTARIMMTALERVGSKDDRLKAKWLEAIERTRSVVNQDLRRHLWVLGTIGSAAPFIGLFGTVVGILRSFGNIAITGQGGFTVVAAGISEALIATAAGIVVAVLAVFAYNGFLTKVQALIVAIRLQTEEFTDYLDPRNSG